ncbi:MAG: hypothetical protein ACR2HO_01375, partial [Rubrobacteraceae bacterium]
MAENLQLALDLYPEDLPRVRTPREHGELLHAGGQGTVAISHKSHNRWNQTVYPVEVALALLDQYCGRDDVFLSTQRFRGRRRISELLSMGALFADLDYYGRPGLAAEDPRRVLELALGTLSMAGVPAPSIAIGSGRGMYLIWLHSPIPRAALPRWRACQERLKDLLANLGADPKARDAARVLRVVGTRHRRARATVEALTTTREARPFDELADRILPYTRAVHRHRQRPGHVPDLAALPDPARRAPPLESLPGAPEGHPRQPRRRPEGQGRSQGPAGGRHPPPP